jgi:hypothetical protein
MRALPLLTRLDNPEDERLVDEKEMLGLPHAEKPALAI